MEKFAKHQGGVIYVDGEFKHVRPGDRTDCDDPELVNGPYYCLGHDLLPPAHYTSAYGYVGGAKNDENKLRYDLLPWYPLEELARVYTIGARKYADHNWRKGFKWGRIFSALCRHAWAWWRGERLDPVDGQEHLASVAWCAFTLMEFEKFKIGEDDRWK